jgi:hypothetical protein
MNVESECSSAEEERRARAVANSSAVSAAASPAVKRQRQVKRDASRVAIFHPQLPEGDYSDLITMQEIPVGEIPQLKDLSQLLEDCKSLGQNIDGSPICDMQRMSIQSGRAKAGVKRKESPTHAESAAAAASSSVSAAAVDTSVVNSESDLAQALQACILAGQPDVQGHWVMDEYNRLLQDLPVPEFYDPRGLAAPITQELLQTQLQRRQFFLPTQSSLLESHLLAESGTFISLKTNKEFFFPPCRNGQRCVGMTHKLRLQPRPLIFTMIFFEQEYEYFCRTGKPPNASRPCVQCSRHHLTACVVFERGERMCGEATVGDTVLPLQREGKQIRQFYQNIVDAPGGYSRIHCLVSNHTPDDPVLEPICMPGRSVIFCKLSPTLVNKETRQPRVLVDQSAIVWTAPTPPQPAIGANLYSFCGGASKH